MKTQSLMGFKCRKPKTQSRPLFFLPLFMRSQFLISQSMASCRDPEATTRKSVLAPVSPKQDRTGQEKIIRVLSWSYKERNSVEWKRCSENAGNLSWPLKNLMHKNSGKRKLEKNVWNCECTVKFSIVACQQLDSNGIIHECMHARMCTKNEKQERAPAHAGWLSEEGGLTPLTSQVYSRFCGKPTFFTALLVLPLLRPWEVALCSVLVQCEQHPSFAFQVTSTWRGGDLSLWHCISFFSYSYFPLFNKLWANQEHEGSRGYEYSSLLADCSAERLCKLRWRPGYLGGSCLLCYNSEW